jgi:uncharacterized protein
MKKVVIAGGTGFLGKILSEHFAAQGWHVVILSRGNAFPLHQGIQVIHWDARSVGDWEQYLENTEVLINLCGRSVDCRYNEKNKRLIYASRLESTTALGTAIRNLNHPPKVWLNASSATIYRHSEDREMDEMSGELGSGFSVDVCQKWEKTFFDCATPHTRKIALRTALVLGKHGGVFPVYKSLVHKGLGGIQGNGKQFVSWLHARDFIDIISFIIRHPEMQGAVNVCAPEPVTNRKFMKSLRESLGIGFGLRTYTWMLKIGALLMGTEEELVLKSRRVVPGKLAKAGYRFEFSNIKAALEDLAVE